MTCDLVGLLLLSKIELTGQFNLGKERSRMERSLNQDQVERAARMYKTNQDAARALGIAMQSFGRICRKYAIETPYVRKRRLKRETGKNRG